MYCKSCGEKIDNDSLFCSICGTRQSEINRHAVDRPNDPKQNHKSAHIEPKYDTTYAKETNATFIGAGILVSTITLLIFKPYKFAKIDDYNQFSAFSSIAILVLRIIITSWVANIAKRQNRNKLSWGTFAFFLPSVALILIGTQKKLSSKVRINSVNDDDQSSEENKQDFTDEDIKKRIEFEMKYNLRK